MDVLRTPDERFDNLSGYAFDPRYVDIDAGGQSLRMHYLDEGPRDGEPVLCLHGQPSWSYLYRKMIPLLTGAGYRVLAPDLIGFGKSDKPASMDDYTYAGHVDWLDQWLTQLDLTGLTLVCQDWGGLIGLRVVARHPDRFARLVIANTGLPNSSTVPAEMVAMLGQFYSQVPVPTAEMVVKQFRAGAPAAFLYWVKYASESPSFSVRDVFGILSQIDDPAILDGYVAPFPDDRYIAGARKFPALVPLLPQHEAERKANDAAWAVLETFERPVLTAFTDDDPVTRGGEKPFQTRIPGAKGRQHVTIKGGGHFLQEMQPEAFSNAIIDFIRETPVA
ncbi:MAG: haloalkane dehalogenase [Hyphomonadaceae bacterium]